MNNINNFNFQKAYEKAKDSLRSKNTIGRLSEKILHATLKYYFEEYEESHEIKIGSFVADIVGENGIIEIQTRDFYKLNKKLEAFLPAAKVTVVYPIPYSKWLFWINPFTGDVTKKRKSPKTGTPYEAFIELYKIKKHLTHENFNLCIMMIDIEEYRKLDGWSKDKKKGSTRSERIPIDLHEEIYINNIQDYKKLIPENLPDKFTTKDYKKATGLTLSASQTALNVMYNIGAIERVDKRGNLQVYECRN